MMFVPTPELPFVKWKDLSFDTYEPLLEWVFLRPEFRQWSLPGCKWQLRFVGGPGSGKTTLSALTVGHLRSVFPCSNVRVASIFFTHSSSLDDASLAQHFLQELCVQLYESTDPTPTPTTSISSRIKSSLSAPASFKLKKLRKALAARLAQLNRTFLILDDVDLCSQSQWAALENEIARLQSHGMNVLITSRLSLWHPYSSARCDTEPAHRYMCSRLFWYCACQTSFERALTVCQVCKDAGYRCGECHQNTNFVEPYDYVGLSINVDEDLMSDYVSHMLELTHGDLGFQTSVEIKPPLSKLGIALSASVDAATQLREKIVSDADGNIAMARLRLEDVDGASTIEEVLRYGDRLPPTVVSLLDHGIASVQKQGPKSKDLGLIAIVGVANEFCDRPFSDLQRWLQKQMNLDQSHVLDITVEEVLRAAGGFIAVGHDRDRSVRMYHDILLHYVAERYNEALFWTYTSTNTVDADEFEKPKRTQTWHASRKNLKRADTWK